MSTVGTGELVSRPAKKSIGTFISQSSAGGVISIFLFLLLVVFRHPNGYNFLLIPIMPIILLVGAVLGAGCGALIWLIEPLFRFRFGALVRSAVTVGLIALILGVGDFQGGSPIGKDLIASSLVTAGVIGLPISLLTSSNIEAWWLVLFGSSRIALSGWLTLLAGFAFRVASLAGLAISLFFLAWWGSFYAEEWPLVSLNLTYIVLAILYFAASSYVSFRPPRGWSLIVATLVLNAPLAWWALKLVPAANPDLRFLGIISFIFIGLWSAFVACLLLEAVFRPLVREPATG